MGTQERAATPTPSLSTCGWRMRRSTTDRCARAQDHYIVISEASHKYLIWFLSSPQVEEELLEQEFLERCFQEMLEEEDQDWFIPSRDLNNQGVAQLQQQLNGLSVSDHHSNLEEVAVRQRSI